MTYTNIITMYVQNTSNECTTVCDCSIEKNLSNFKYMYIVIPNNIREHLSFLWGLLFCLVNGQCILSSYPSKQTVILIKLF